ncbi:NAD(P)/FAD-dependent oxidoreductase [Sphingomonas qomolangmaensis]|uniref:FAD-dependent monooxygenase n=1 Tax=Sphingomonas qomolangmaensis TaxID=2918765 RepID=A0ABY5L820_9SPHN|nr:FAD-dependent monooxygenase [Sphingomonas qomolangmaensis]UUL81949.1 FAD-dependent monooxygenase [Sphingomonas qomolangmaensis]
MQAPLIVGAGPAGCAAAITLARAGAPPLVIERNAETGDAICGGFLSWCTLDALERLGIARDTLGAADVTRVRLFAGSHRTEAALPHAAKGVSRRHLDTLMQAHAMTSGATIDRGVAVRGFDDGTLRLADGGELAPPTLFLATGKHDLRGLPRDTPTLADPTIGLRTRIPPAPGLTRLVRGAIELHLFDRGYVGLMLQEDGSANLCLAVRRSRMRAEGDPEALLAAIGREVPALGDRLAYGSGAIDAIANVPYGWRALAAPFAAWRLGDQAAVIPSLAGEGMGIAIASGVAAAHAWAAGATADTYQRAFAQRSRAPVARARLLRDLAERPAGARLLLAAAAAIPGGAALAARLTRITHLPIDARPPAQHI